MCVYVCVVRKDGDSFEYATESWNIFDITHSFYAAHPTQTERRKCVCTFIYNSTKNGAVAKWKRSKRLENSLCAKRFQFEVDQAENDFVMCKFFFQLTRSQLLLFSFLVAVYRIAFELFRFSLLVFAFLFYFILFLF